MKAVILAAGEGSRLRPLTFTRPKPMIPLAREPAIYHVLSQLKREGFDEIVMVVGPMREQIMNYLGDGSKLGQHITYAIKPDEFQSGTAGSLKLVEHLLDDTFLVAQSDTLSEIPLSDAVRAHGKSGASATVVLTEVKDPSLYGVAVLDEGNVITGFQEKPIASEAKSKLVSTGFYILEPDTLDHVLNEKFDFAKDLFPRLLDLRKRIVGYTSDAFWVDIGSLEGYLEGVSWELEGMTRYTYLNQPATDPIDNVISEKNVRIGNNVRITGPVYIESDAVIEDNARIRPFSVIKRSVHISQGAVLERCVIQERATIGKDCRIVSSVIGQSATIQNDVSIEGSSVGPGSVIRERANILDGSRIWPNVEIGDGETVNGTVKVPLEKSFYFNTALGEYTGVLASTGDGFIKALAKVPIESIEFHSKRRDFEKWARGVLASDQLANDIEDLRRRTITGEELRRKLITVTNNWAYGQAQNSTPSRGVTMPEKKVLIDQVSGQLGDA